jgi:4-hydroxy-tetrahydrodipicolinate synthase
MVPSFGFASMIDAPNPIPTKAMLRMLGYRVGYGRSPMHIEPPGLEAAAKALLEDSGLAIEASVPA